MASHIRIGHKVLLLRTPTRSVMRMSIEAIVVAAETMLAEARAMKPIVANMSSIAIARTYPKIG
ncbi:MAG: hypothetical protein OEZ24_05800 [Candidatus Bathyarchaeota archaeon]|nr:hypothetical protein [Candidatus Bathyarchaeota archaeon]